MTMWSGRRWAGIAVVVALASVIGACSPGGVADVEREDFEGAVGAIYFSDFGEELFLAQAEETLTARCMRARGWEYSPPPSKPAVAVHPSAVLTPAEQWAFDDVVRASRSGFGIGDALARVAGDPRDLLADSPPDAAFAARPDGFLQDLQGSPDQSVIITELDGSQTGVGAEGCAAEARRAVWGTLEDYLTAADVVGFLQAEAMTRTRSRVQDRLREWETCMEGRGWNVPGDEDLEPENIVWAAWSAYGEVDPDAAASEERRLAIAHAECSRESGLGQAFRSAYVDVATSLIVRYEGAVIETRERISEAVERARNALGGDGR